MIELNRIYNEDCLEGMKRIPDQFIDCIICDLPYGTTSFDILPRLKRVGVCQNLNTVLETNPDEIDRSLYASSHILAKRKEKTKDKEHFFPSIWHENKAGNISILPYACALRTGASYNYLLVNGERRPTSRELLNFQGFPKDFKIVVSHSEIRKQTGNSVAVPMIRAIAARITNICNEIQ